MSEEHPSSEVQSVKESQGENRSIRVPISPEVAEFLKKLVEDNYVRNRVPEDGLTLYGNYHQDREQNIGGHPVGSQSPRGMRLAITDDGLVGEWYSQVLGRGGLRYTNQERGQKFDLSVIEGQNPEVEMTPRWDDTPTNARAEEHVRKLVESLSIDDVIGTLTETFFRRYEKGAVEHGPDGQGVLQTGFVDQEATAVKGSILEEALAKQYSQTRKEWEDGTGR